MVFSPGAQLISGNPVGTERVIVDNGGSVIAEATTAQIANAPGVFGSGSAAFGRSGNINTQVSRAGIQPASTGADIVVAAFTLPANSYDQLGRTLQIQAEGSFAATVNNKRVKLFIGATTAVVGQAITGGTAIADSGTVTTNGGGWALSAEVVKDAPVNTQLAVHQQAQLGGAVATLLAPQSLAMTENAPILIAVTANAATAASDILFNFMQIFAQN